jgi:hypothetical protein
VADLYFDAKPVELLGEQLVKRIAIAGFQHETLFTEWLLVATNRRVKNTLTKRD